MFRLPIQAIKMQVTSGYGTGLLNGKPRDHNGIDIRASTGTPLVAIADGTVIKSALDNLNGNFVVIQHAGGFMSGYAHLSERAVQVGQKVKEGEVIGKAGNTGHSFGDHLHLTLRKDGKTVDPLLHFSRDAWEYIGKGKLNTALKVAPLVYFAATGIGAAGFFLWRYLADRKERQ